MSLFSALNVAVSSITSLNTAVRTTSDNVANANNENYNRRQVIFEGLETGGVKIADVERIVNEGLFRDLIQQTSAAKGSEVRDKLYQEIDQLLGSAGGSTPLSDAVEDFRSAWKAFEATPEIDAAEAEVIQSAKSLVREMQRLSDGLDIIEQRVLADIDDVVTDLNTSLQEIDRLNAEIVAGLATDRDVSSLQNLRDKEVQRVSEIMEVRTFKRDDGSIGLYTSTGLDLTDRSASTFTWNSATRTLTKSGSSSTNLITDGRVPDGELSGLVNFIRTDASAMTNGELGMATIEKFRSYLNDLSFALADDSNGRSTGTTDLRDFNNITSASSGPITNGSTLTFTTPAGSSLGTVTINNGAIDTLEEVVADINANVTNVRARIDGQGRLQVLSDIGAVTVGGAAATDFGLSSITQDTDETFHRAYKKEFSTGTVDISGNANLTATPITNDPSSFDVTVGGNTTTVTIDSAGTNTTTALIDSLNQIDGVFAELDSNGGLRISSIAGNLALAENTGTPLADLGFSMNGTSAIIDNKDASTDSNNFFEEESGSTTEGITRTNFQVASGLDAGTSTLKFTSSNTVIEALNVQARNINGSGLSLSSETYSGLASGIVTDFVKQAERADRAAVESETLRSNLSQILRDELGVDIDEEMARLTVLQNSYSASARVIDTVNRMFDQLEAAIR